MGKKKSVLDSPDVKELYKQFLHNKNLALVSPSPYLQYSKPGKDIDSADVVISFNNMMDKSKMDTEAVGSRLDVNYFNGTRRIFNTAYCSFQFFTGSWFINTGIEKKDGITEMMQSHCRFRNVHFMKIGEEDRLPLDNGKNVSTGIRALRHLIRFDFKTLKIYGMFHPTNSMIPGYNKLNHPSKRHAGYHDFAKEAEIMLDVVSKDSRIYLDYLGGTLALNYKDYEVQRF